MDTEEGKDKTIFELTCGGVDAGVEGKGLVVLVVSQAETGICL